MNVLELTSTTGPETQRTIYEWGQATFGQPSALSIMSRFLVEVVELNDLLVRQSELRARLLDPARTNQTLEELRALEAKIADELADAQVVLDQVAEACDVRLEQAKQAKMKINRARQWEQLPGGRFQHVSGT